MSTLRFIAVSLFVSILVAPAAFAQSNAVMTEHRVAELRNVSAAEISPDGARIAYVVAVPRVPGVDEDGGSWGELHVVEVASGNTRPFVTGKLNVGHFAWTNDGRSLAYLSKRNDDKQTALYVIPIGGGESRRALALADSITAFDLHRDGVHVALIAADPIADAKKKAQDKGFKQEIYEEEERCSHLWIGSLAGDADKPRKLDIAGHVSDAKWSPTDERIAIKLAATALTDDSYMRTRVVVVDSADGRVLATIESAGKLGDFAWSPDGTQIALSAGGDIHDPDAGRLMLAPAAGGVPQEVLPGIEGDTAAFAFQAPDALLAVLARGVWTSFEKIPLGGKPTVLIPTGGAILTSMSLSADGLHAAFVANSPAHASEVYTMSHGEAAPRRVTDNNPWLASTRLAPQEVVTFNARDGLALEGVLVRPLDEKKGQRYPLLMYVHGGPEAHHSNGWLTNYGDPAQTLAARGFAVFHVNYRGSTGRGMAFAKASQGDPAGKEFDDLIDAIDHLVGTGLVDKDKVAVTGGSYGGYATAWLSTRYSDRIAAGVMFVGISDKLSKVGTTDIPDEEFYVHALHRPWDNWQWMLERSPIYYAGQCNTPLLILHGKDDPRVNPGQSREMYRHLKLRSTAPVRLVLYPGEGHGNRKAADRLDYNLRMDQWIEHYLVGPKGEMPPLEIDYAESKSGG